jgi:hypothetical protein
VINVSTTGEKARFLNENDDEHFLRIPVNDCHNAQLLPYFDQAYTFIGKDKFHSKIHFFLLFFLLEEARLNNGRVFIHCLGIYISSFIHLDYYFFF